MHAVLIFIIETKYEKDNAAMETVKSLFTIKSRDFITAVDERSIILVKEVKEGEDYPQMEENGKDPSGYVKYRGNVEC